MLYGYNMTRSEADSFYVTRQWKFGGENTFVGGLSNALWTLLSGRASHMLCLLWCGYNRPDSRLIHLMSQQWRFGGVHLLGANALLKPETGSAAHMSFWCGHMTRSKGPSTLNVQMQTQANWTCCCEWECLHWIQVTLKELPVNLPPCVQCGLGLKLILFTSERSEGFLFSLRPHVRGIDTHFGQEIKEALCMYPFGVCVPLCLHSLWISLSLWRRVWDLCCGRTGHVDPLYLLVTHLFM